MYKQTFFKISTSITATIAKLDFKKLEMQEKYDFSKVELQNRDTYPKYFKKRLLVWFGMNFVVDFFFFAWFCLFIKFINKKIIKEIIEKQRVDFILNKTK